MNRPSTWPYLAILVLASVGGVALFKQWAATQRLRVEVEVAREQQRLRTQLAGENRRLAAAQIPDDELERLRGDRAALARLKSEVEAAKTRTDTMERTAKTDVPPGITWISASAWKDAGRKTPVAALQSTLWALAHADLDSVAVGFAWDPVEKPEADALWAQLPEATRKEYGSSEKMVAALLARTLEGIAAVGVIDQREEDSKTVVLRARLENDDHTKGMTEGFELHRGEDGWQWRLALRHSQTVLLFREVRRLEGRR